jgi:hypothetical protein
LHRGDLIKLIVINTDGFGFQVESLVKLIKAGATYATVGVRVLERREGRSSALRPRNVYRVAMMMPILWFEVLRARLSSRSQIGSVLRQTPPRISNVESSAV